MATKKKAPTFVEEFEVEVPETQKEEDEVINTLSWKEIQAKYGILTDEILDKNSDLSKYKISKEDEKVLRDYVEKVYKDVADFQLDMIHAPVQVKQVFEFYGITAEDIRQHRLEDKGLKAEEIEIVTDYYNELFRKNAVQVKKF